ncbi:endonuclease domain-containing protein [uncultured Mycobacterium sp.]|uniref:endonuclease domain-containing protein n=1 Tax=uncultured Mycobacterium sp. TaxID=171292 RepID=UPI0035CC6039
MTTTEPFIGSEALAGGVLRWHQLRSGFRAVFPDVYVRRDQQLTLQQRAVAAWLWSHRQGVVAGLTAAAWHGSKWVDDRCPIELFWSNARPPCGVRTSAVSLHPDESHLVAGLPVTTPVRTAFDIGRRRPVGAAVAHMDALVAATGVDLSDVAELAGRHRGARGLRQLETVLEFVDAGAQSPKETWLRLLLIRAGLPRPRTQIPVVSADGRQTYYLDMGWEDVMVAVEYDGEHHRLDRWQYARDIRRCEELERLGWIVIRVLADDRPADIIRRVRDALESRRSSLR